MEYTPDDLDQTLIETLREDGRVATKTLANKLGVTEKTVAARIRNLEINNIMRVVLRQDLYSKGFTLQCWVDIYVAGRSTDKVVADLDRIETKTSVSVMFGSPEILLVFNALDQAHLASILELDIGAIKGISRIEVHTAVDIRKYMFGSALLDEL